MWLIFACLLYLVQVLPYLSHRWVTDESWYAGPAYSIAQGHGVRDPEIGPNDLENRLDTRPPGTALVIAGAFRLFGVGQDQARIGSLLAGLALVLLTYRLTRDVFGEDGAVVAALLVATDNIVVMASRTARPEALTAMAVFASLLALKRYARTGRVSWAFGSGLLIAGATMFHVTVLGYVISCGLLAIYLDRRRGGVGVRAPAVFSAGYLLGLVPFVVWVLGNPLGKESFRHEYMVRVAKTSVATKLSHEAHRYFDVLGLNLLHGHGLQWIPLRLPIPMVFFVASYLLWRYRRSWFYVEMVLLLPTMIWFIDTANKSVRYVAILAPLMAITIGAAIAATRLRTQLRRLVIAAAGLVILAQAASNLALLNGARKADYNKVGAQLRSVIPADATTYGSIAFWLAFRDRAFISDERTEPEMAATEFHARYFILGDRLMTGQNGSDIPFAEKLRQNLAAIVERSDLVGEFPDPYYGDLKVYRLRD